MRQVIKDILYVFIVVIGLFVVMGLVGWGGNALSRLQCKNLNKSLVLPTKYSTFGGGCFVEYKGQWYPWRSFRGNQLSQ